MGLGVGSYRVFERLAQGLSTETMMVNDAARTVKAVAKRLLPQLRDNPTARAQLDVEARVLRALSGRGAPRLLDVGEDAEGPWLVMEYVDMPPLSGRTSGTHRARADFVRDVAEPSFRALGIVHEASDAEGPLAIVHGDVSPDNLLAHDDPWDARLIDFGLASFRDAPPTPASSLRGTPRYMAPEVARGEPATARSDLFSLGLTLLHAASGEAARAGNTLAALLVVAGELSVVAYAERASHELEPALRDALLAMVAFEPRDRPKTAREAWRRGSW